MPYERKIINDPVFGFINIPKGLLYDIGKRLRDSILSPFFHSYIFAMYKNEALWI